MGAVALMASGCVADFDVSDKPCPCAQGFVCVDGERCAPEAEVDGGPPAADGGTPDDAGTPDAGTPDAGPPPARIRVIDLHSDWQTPNSLHWRWTIEGDDADFEELRLVIAESEEDVVAQSGTARIVDHTERASLGVYYRLRVTGERDVVDGVITDEHTPDTRYFAQMIAIDNRGNESRSNVAPARTLREPIDGLLLFSDDRPPGYPLPPSTDPSPLRYVSDSPYQGTHHLAYEHAACPDGSSVICFENLRWQDIGAGPLAMSGGTFTLAYLEMAVSVESTEPSFWSEIGITLDPAEGESGASAWVYKPFVPRYDGEYHLVQIPLHVLKRNGSTLTHERATATTVDGFRFGAIFPIGARARVDEVWIRW